MVNWMLEEMLIEARAADVRRTRDAGIAAFLAEEQPASLRRAIASGLVRLGMLLDRGAGERLVAARQTYRQAAR